jgi:hypothetical protein
MLIHPIFFPSLHSASTSGEHLPYLTAMNAHDSAPTAKTAHGGCDMGGRGIGQETPQFVTDGVRCETVHGRRGKAVCCVVLPPCVELRRRAGGFLNVECVRIARRNRGEVGPRLVRCRLGQGSCCAGRCADVGQAARWNLEVYAWSNAWCLSGVCVVLVTWCLGGA